jgi:1,4-alpha-glucan branching enzyme
MILLASASKSWNGLFGEVLAAAAFLPKTNKKRIKMKTQLSNDKGTQQHTIPFTFPAPGARKVSLAGDFNNWDPEAMPMYKGTDGVWYLSVSLNPGRHEYRFVADGVWQDDPAAQQRTANTMGTENCVRTVAAEIIDRRAQLQIPAPTRKE